MKSLSGTLPSFKSPPVDEVAIAVQFQGIERFSIVYGAFFEKVRDRLPSYEEHDPIPVQFETFGRSTEGLPEFSLESLSLRRAWYISKDGHHLVQLQPNRLVQNWRKLRGEGTYPRWPAVFQNFSENLEILRGVLSDLELAQPIINQAEITYFNNIELIPGESYVEAFERIFGWPSASRLRREVEGFRWEPEAAVLNTMILVRAPGSDEPCARLVARAAPAETETGSKMVRFELRYRGPPTDSCDLEDFLHTGRNTIVYTFTDLTSEKCHKIWEREV
jgi:uncharacterized protein (TIGR04255 family)